MENALSFLLGTHPSWSLLIVRLALGVMFVAHGGQKLFGWFGGPGLKATIQVFQQYLKIPPAAAVTGALIEFGSGLGMLLGLLARPAAVGIIVVMLVAIAKVHGRNGFFINFENAPGRGHGFELNFVLIAMALAVLVGGAGILSIDRAIWLWGD